MSDGQKPAWFDHITKVTVIDEVAELEARRAVRWSFAAVVLSLAALLIVLMGGCVCQTTPTGTTTGLEWPEAMVWCAIAVCWTVYTLLTKWWARR